MTRTRPLTTNSIHSYLQRGRKEPTVQRILLFIFCFMLTFSALPVMAQQKPNILVIITDQQTASAMSAAGNKELHTPAMDKLATSGVRFTRAYCAQPLCTPSRTAIFSGKMPYQTGFVANEPEKDGLWPDSLLMLGKVFNTQGYQTGYVGKWHLPVPVDKIRQHGFDYIKNTDFQDFNDGATPSYVARFIKANKDKEKREGKRKPFLLVASFLNPHDICEWARKDDLKMDVLTAAPAPDSCPPLPTNWQIPANEPEMIRVQQKSNERTYPSIHWTPGQWRQYRWAYDRLVEKVDKYIEQVLYALKKYDVADNTIILFTSDHGDGYGEHSWNQKQVLYEASIKVPFIVAKLGQWKSRTDSMLVCNGLDIIPTLCGFAHIKAPAYLNGLDLSKNIHHSQPPLRDTLVIETDFADNELLLGISGRAVITNRLKYIVYSKGKIKEQLFDLSNDPGEINNLAVLPAYHKELQAMRNYLKVWCKKNKDHFGRLLD